MMFLRKKVRNTKKVVKHHQAHVIEVRFDAHYIDVVILPRSWCLSSGQPWSEELPMQDKAMAVSQSVPQGLTYLRTLTGNEKGSNELMVLRVRPSPSRPSRADFFIPQWTTQPCTI